MIKLPEPVEHQILILGNRWTHCTPILFQKSHDRSIVRALYTEAQLKQFGRDLLKKALNCYSPDDSAQDWADKIRAITKEIPQ